MRETMPRRVQWATRRASGATESTDRPAVAQRRTGGRFCGIAGVCSEWVGPRGERASPLPHRSTVANGGEPTWTQGRANRLQTSQAGPVLQSVNGLIPCQDRGSELHRIFRIETT
jgi:hypothetical protein